MSVGGVEGLGRMREGKEGFGNKGISCGKELEKLKEETKDT